MRWCMILAIGLLGIHGCGKQKDDKGKQSNNADTTLQGNAQQNEPAEETPREAEQPSSRDVPPETEPAPRPDDSVDTAAIQGAWKAIRKEEDMSFFNVLLFVGGTLRSSSQCLFDHGLEVMVEVMAPVEIRGSSFEIKEAKEAHKVINGKTCAVALQEGTYQYDIEGATLSLKTPEGEAEVYQR